MSISGLVPVPSDALVTPVTFQVKRRGLRGILADFDQHEDGTRELSGEWVVGKRTWQRLQAEWQAAKRNGNDSHRSGRPVKRKERVILYLHGGNVADLSNSYVETDALCTAWTQVLTIYQARLPIDLSRYLYPSP